MAAVLPRGTPQGTDKQKDSGNITGKTTRKYTPRDMLYYTQKLSEAQGPDSSTEIKEDVEPLQALESDNGAEPGSYSVH